MERACQQGLKRNPNCSILVQGRSHFSYCPLLVLYRVELNKMHGKSSSLKSNFSVNMPLTFVSKRFWIHYYHLFPCDPIRHALERCFSSWDPYSSHPLNYFYQNINTQLKTEFIFLKEHNSFYFTWLIQTLNQQSHSYVPLVTLSAARWRKNAAESVGQ